MVLKNEGRARPRKSREVLNTVFALWCRRAMDHLEIDPPYAPETTPNERVAILGQIGVVLSNAALRTHQIQGPEDNAVLALIAGDLFEELVTTLAAQIKDKDHFALFEQIISWSAIQAKQSFRDHPNISDEVDVRVLQRRERFSEHLAAQFSERVHPAEVKQDLGARLDEVAYRLKISHEKLAEEIGLSRTAYFEVKAGRGSKRSRHLAEAYLSKLGSGPIRTNPD